jgi:hypothetical protein
MPLHPIHLRAILILSFPLRPCLPSGLFAFGFPTSTLYESSSHASYMPCPSHPSWHDHSPGEEFKLWHSSLCSFLEPPVILSLFGLNILLSILFSDTLSLCSSFNVRDQVSILYKTTCKIIVLYIPILCFYTSDEKTKSSVLNGSKKYVN